MPNEQNVQNDSLGAKAVIFALLGFFFLSLVAIFVKLAKDDANIAWITFIQYAASFMFTLIVMAKYGFASLKTEKFHLHFFRSVSGLSAFVLYVMSLSQIPLVDATLLQNTAPIFIPIIAFVWLRSKMDKDIWLGLIVGFIGILLIIKPGGNQFVLNAGDFYGVAAGVCLALVFVSVKVLSKTEHTNTILFYFSLIAMLISAPFAVGAWINPPLHVWLLVIASGASIVLYQLFLQAAYKYAEPVKLSPFNYSIVVFAGIFDWILFNHVPDWLTIIGIALVTAGGILSVLIHGRKKENVRHNWH